MRTALPILLAVLLAGCDGGVSGPQGPLKLGIIAGNHQAVVAGAEQLTDPVVGKLVRENSGAIAFHFVTPAYAQDGTTVTGSPVAGAVVCAVSVTDGGLTPFTPCTNTASDGTATFFFTPGTKAGEAKSEIRGTVAGQPAVFDTAEAFVRTGPPVTLGNIAFQGPAGGQVDLRKPNQGYQAVQDVYGNHIEADSLVARWTPTWTVYETDPQVIHDGRKCSSPPRIVSSGTGWVFPTPPRFMPAPYTSSEYCLSVAFDGLVVGLYQLGVMHPN